VALTALIAAQASTNATLRSNGTTLTICFILSATAFFLSVVAITMIALMLRYLPKSQNETKPTNKPDVINAQTIDMNIEHVARVFAPITCHLIGSHCTFRIEKGKGIPCSLQE
jgi:hypothetical protein